MTAEPIHRAGSKPARRLARVVAFALLAAVGCKSPSADKVVPLESDRPIAFTALDGPKQSADNFCPGRFGQPVPGWFPSIRARPLYQDCQISTHLGGYSSLQPTLKTAYTLISNKPVTSGSLGLLLETASGFYGGESVILPTDFIKSKGEWLSTNASIESGVLILTTRTNDFRELAGKHPPSASYTTRETIVLCTLSGPPKCSERIRVAETRKLEKPATGEPIWDWRLSTRITAQGIEFLTADGGAPRPPSDSPTGDINGRVIAPGLYPMP